MRKRSYNLLMGVFLFFMAFSVNVSAAEQPFIANGYTENGISYEVYGDYAQPNATTMPVTRHITFNGNVTPPQQFPWQETINGIKYSGTLTLLKYSYVRKDDTTTATYTGILTYYLNQ